MVVEACPTRQTAETTNRGGGNHLLGPVRGLKAVKAMERRLMGLMEMPEVAREPFEDCPRFEKCSVNKCPLSTRYAFLTEVGPDIDDLGRPIEGTGDPERRCMLRRRKREEISAKYPGLLPNGGLTDEEIARDRRRARERAKWEALSPEKKALILSKLLAQKKELD